MRNGGREACKVDIFSILVENNGGDAPLAIGCDRNKPRVRQQKQKKRAKKKPQKVARSEDGKGRVMKESIKETRTPTFDTHNDDVTVNGAFRNRFPQKYK